MIEQWFIDILGPNVAIGFGILAFITMALFVSVLVSAWAFRLGNGQEK